MYTKKILFPTLKTPDDPISEYIINETQLTSELAESARFYSNLKFLEQFT